MNWTAGIVAFILLFVPMLIVFNTVYKRNQEIDRKYEEELKQIKKRFGIKE